MVRPHVVRLLVLDRSPVAAEQLRRDLTSDGSVQAVGPSDRPHIVVTDAAENAGPWIASGIPVVVGIGPGTVDRGLDLLAAGAIHLVDRPYHPEIIVELRRTIQALAAAMTSAVPVRTAADKGSPGVGTIALAAGPGGATALADVLAALPPGPAAVLVIAPLPAIAMSAWASRIARRSARPVRVVIDGDRLPAGQTLICPGDGHAIVRGDYLSIRPGPTVLGRRPAVELLFRSIASPGVTAGLLGGAGIDGLVGLAAVRRAGGRTVVESSRTAAVPESAATAGRANVADRVAERPDFAAAITDFAAGRASTRAA